MNRTVIFIAMRTFDYVMGLIGYMTFLAWLTGALIPGVDFVYSLTSH